jgi:hypothetical protein
MLFGRRETDRTTVPHVERKHDADLETTRMETTNQTAIKAGERTLCGFAIPSEISHIADAVESSRRILDLPDNWDSEGSPGYSHATWERAAQFVLKNASSLWYDRAVVLSAPVISHGPEGSIDVHWQAENHILLINIPAQAGAPVEYYGRNACGYEVKGTLDITAQNHWLMMWQME